MRRRTQILIALMSLALAAAAGVYVYTTFNQMVATAKIVTPAQIIPAGALIEPDMLTVREVPRPLLDEAIYVTADAVIGKVTTIPLQPNMVIYQSFLVGLFQYRLVDDPSLSVVSFPVDPERAVGGQLQPGHRVDIWRMVGIRPTNSTTMTLAAINAQQWATATLLVANAPVVDVRSSTGTAVSRQPQAVPGRAASSSASTSALQILTVGVPPDVTRDILALVGEEDQSGFNLWVTLSPITSTVATPAPAASSTP